jgi:hypothetical protein
MKKRRVGCVAKRIIEKLNSPQDLSVEELAMHVYGDAGWRSMAHTQRAIKLMALPEGWAQRRGPGGAVLKLVRIPPPEVRKAYGKLIRNRIKRKTLMGA